MMRCLIICVILVGCGTPPNKILVFGQSNAIGLAPYIQEVTGIETVEIARSATSLQEFEANLEGLTSRALATDADCWVWFQGERNARAEHYITDYEDRLVAYLSQFPSCGVIVKVWSAYPSGWPYMDKVREAQSNAAKRLGVGLVESMDLPRPDRLHLGNEGKTALAERI